MKTKIEIVKPMKMNTSNWQRAKNWKQALTLTSQRQRDTAQVFRERRK